MNAPLVSARNLERAFNIGSEKVVAVRDVSLDVYAGQLLVITGRSGSGKTTLLNLLGGWIRQPRARFPSKGRN